MHPAFPPPGRLVDIGGYRLHINIQGQGSPVAVLDSGLTGNTLIWGKSLAAVAGVTQAAAFDRAGYAWSDPAPPGTPRHSQQLVAEQRTLLANAGLPPPYILVGHSFGAINTLVYASTYPDEVAGLVLVDPSHPEMMVRAPGVPSAKTMQRSMQVLAFLGRFGLLRLIGPRFIRFVLPNGPEQLEPADWIALVAFMSAPKEYQTSAREVSFGERSFAMARLAPGSLGDLPLDVLTADAWVTGKPSPMKAAMAPLRTELAALSRRGRHRIVTGCAHGDLPTARPDEVAAAVRWVLEQGATGS